VVCASIEAGGVNAPRFNDDRAAAGEALKASAFDLGADPALIVDRGHLLMAANLAAEALFGHTLSLMAREPFTAAFPPGAAVSAMIDRCFSEEAPVRARGLDVAVGSHAPLLADVAVGPLAGGAALVSLHVRGATPEAGTGRGGLRSLMGLGQMLAHEINNPLAGIRGAAQLLKAVAEPQDIPLAQLIVDETDRIGRLVGRMEAFSDDTEPRRAALNIHRVLDRVRALAANSVADGLTVRENYDPSLPAVWGEEDQLIQVFLNLAKNAAEAAHARGDGRGEITLSTAFHHGARVRRPNGYFGAGAPLEVTIVDNGRGVPNRVRDHLFEPFVTTKTRGTGLGLALAAKIVASHGGSIDFESEPGRTMFRVRLPVAPSPAVEDLPT
jgi:two-component system, NtrC family, nitrogen regulation sensor histidine kinase GlnL